jgi:hypothetical protein
MMPEISLNILDVVENSIKAKANEIGIWISIQTRDDTLTVKITDNGHGMSKEQLERAQDPFYTTRTTRKVGLGIPFLKQAAESTLGTFAIDSEIQKGTKVEAVFKLSHIDRMPLGDISATIYALVVFNEKIRFKYTYKFDDKEFTLDTKEIREIVGDDVSFQQSEISKFIKEFLEVNKKETDGGVA